MCRCPLWTESRQRIKFVRPSLKPARDIPIIALTAHARVDDKKECLDAGMDDYLSKPIVARRLYELLDEYLPESPTETRDSLDKSTSNAPSSISNQDDTLSIFDPETLLEIVLDDKALATMIATQVIDDLNDLMEPLENAISTEDVALTGTTLHTLKGVCSNAGAHRLRQETIHLESLVESGEVDKIKEQLPLYKELLSATVKELEYFIA